MPQTDLFAMTDAEWNDGLSLKFRFAAEAGTSRYGQPEEIADLIAFLVSPAARTTGTAVRMDEGEAKAIQAKAADAHSRQRVAVLDSDLSYIDTGAGDRLRLGSR